MEKLFNKEEAAAFILNKFREQGDFSFVDEGLFSEMVRTIQDLDAKYIEQCESEDAVYDEITALRDAAYRMLELAADILKNRMKK